jgi:type I restriction enzyme R subunit
MIAKDIVEHFENRQTAMETPVGKAMIVAMSRRIAVELYKEIIKLRPNWHSEDLYKGKIKVVMTGASSDPEEWQVHVGNKQKREILAKRMKDNKDELEIAIVRDMWLTGFDVPSLHTMYIDKPMKGHGLMQTIARVNRVFGKKQGGLVVDYIGIAANLRDALNDYTDKDKDTAGVDTDAAVSILLEKISIIRDMLHPHDYQLYFTGSKGDKLKTIVKTVNFVLGFNENDKKTFTHNVDDMSKAFGLCSTTDKAQEVNEEVGFYKAIKAAAMKFNRPDGLPSPADVEIKLDQLLSEAFKGDGMIDVMEEIGSDKPELSILSDKFMDHIIKSEHKNIAIELLKRLIQGSIKRVSRRTVIQSRQFSDLLTQLMENYYGRLLTSAEIIDELIKLAKDIMNAEEKGKSSGLSVEEYAFYEALSSNTSAMEVMGTDILKDIARELTKTIKQNATVDWNLRKSVQAKIMFEIQVLLKKYKYPPDDPNEPNNYKKSINLIMEQTELLASETN